MSLAEYEDFVYRACLLHHDDPAAAWRALAERQARLVEVLRPVRELRLANQGSGLLFGSVSCEETPWLAFGDSRHHHAMVLKKGGVIWLDGTANPGGMMLRAQLPPRVLRSI